MSEQSLYSRLGGYDAISAVCADLLPRLRQDKLLGRFWAHRGDDGIAREQQLLVDFLCAQAGGPMVYAGRDMKITHVGMRISKVDWDTFVGHLQATLDKFSLPEAERNDVLQFIESTRAEIVEA